MCMDTDKLSVAVIEIVGSLAKIEIENANGIDFLYLVIFVTKIDMLRYCL